MAYSRAHDAAFWDEHLGSPDGVKFWHFYAYEHLDDLAFMPTARQALAAWPHAGVVIAAVEEKFRSLGWVGDGEMQVMWFPPFAGVAPKNTFGAYALHVKQSDDGISWIACPYTLPFHRLFQPDWAEYAPPGTPFGEIVRRKGAVRWIPDPADRSDQT
jgi:hypothetical protein